LKSFYTSDTTMNYQDLPDALNDVSDEFAFIVIGEIYSPGNFYWFLRDSKKILLNSFLMKWRQYFVKFRSIWCIYEINESYWID